VIQTETLPGNSPAAIDRAAELLSRGELVAFPTDTVYGVGALASDPQAIAQLYVVKGRTEEKAIPILLSDPAQLELVALEASEMALRLARRFWPGALTMVLPRHPSLPREISSQPTVGVRMPDHPVALRLIRLSGPLAVTSANRSGGANAVTAEEVFEQLGGRIPLILDGGSTPGGSPSTVVDCTGAEPRILRQGPISLKEILKALYAQE
jgi:L-threonylcarbamoyladenylate synthase